MTPPLTAVLLDVNGTLTDTAPLGAALGDPGLGDRVLDTAVHTAMVDALLARERPFADHLRAAVTVVAGVGDGDPVLEAALAAAAALPARPGAAPALRRLRDAGLRVVALTNSGAAGGRATLAGAGLEELVDDVLGVDAVGTFKPHPDVYAHALRALDVAPAHAASVALLATHPWDLAGAAAGGLRTAWVTHGERIWPSVFPAPDVRGATLSEACAGLAALASA